MKGYNKLVQYNFTTGKIQPEQMSVLLPQEGNLDYEMDEIK